MAATAKSGDEHRLLWFGRFRSRNLTFFSNMVIGRENTAADEAEWLARDAADRAERATFRATL